MIPIDEVFKDGVDATMIDLWQQCRRKFFNRIIRGLDMIRPNTAAMFGGVVHEFLEAYLKGGEVDRCLKVWENYPDEVDDERRTRAKGIELCKGYVREYPRESDPFEVLETEKTFGIDIGATVPLIGRRDGVVKDRDGGGIWVLEHKTTSYFGDTYYDQFEIATAVDGYILSTAKEYGSCEGVLFNVLVSSVKTPRFDRARVTRMAEQLDYWRKDIASIVDEMVRQVKEIEPNSKFYPMSRARCRDWNAKCAYFDVCKYADNLKLIEGEFVERQWTPVRRTEGMR